MPNWSAIDVTYDPAMSAANQIVTGDRVARFVGDRNAQRVIPPYTALGVECRGDIIAGAVFRNYTGPTSR
jgi:hypothetical protein